MKMTTKDFLNRYDEFMNEKDNSNELDTPILNITKAVKSPKRLPKDT